MGDRLGIPSVVDSFFKFFFFLNFYFIYLFIFSCSRGGVGRGLNGLYFRVLLIFLSSLLISFSPHEDICVCALAGGGGVIAVEIINSVEYLK